MTCLASARNWRSHTNGRESLTRWRATASAERAGQSIKRFYDSGVNRKVKGSNKRKKAINKQGRKHLKVSRQRKDFAVKLARCVVSSKRVRNLVKNHCLAKSISDAAWRMFFDWLEYYGQIFGKIVVPVPPQWSSQECSSCGQIVQKSLSTRTHMCSCGASLCRDENAAKVLLARGLRIASTLGHSGIHAQGQTNQCQSSENLIDKLTG